MASLKASPQRKDIFNVTSAIDDDSYQQNFSNKNMFQCYHNNRGYCSFREKCRYPHYKQVCPKTVCRERECKKRHPVTCKFRENCKFHKKAICAFKHVTLTNEEKERIKIDEAMNKLLEEKKILIREIESLKAKNEMLEVELNRYVTPMHDEEIGLVEPVEQIEETCINVCDKCDFTAHSTADLNTHISEKHTNKKLKINACKLFLCDHCSFASNSEEKFKNHARNNHSHQ